MIELCGFKLSDKWPFALCGLSLTYGKSAVTFAVSSLICIVLFVPQAWNYKQHGCLFTHCVACPTGVEQHCCLFTHLHCVICPTGLELQAASLSLHALCYLSHRCGTTSSTAVSSHIVLFVPQVWNYKQHCCLFTHCVICPTGVELQAALLSLHSLFVPQVWNYKQHCCLFTHCVICPTGVELQAALLSLHALCYLSHRCGTTSSTAVSSRIVLFVPHVWNYKQHGCLFTCCDICPTGVELQAAPLSLHSAGTPGLHPYHLLPSCQCLLQSLLEYFSSLTCLHALCVFVFSLNCLLWSFIFLVCLSVLFSSVFFFLCCLFASKLALVYGSQYYANESNVKADSEQNLCFILFLSFLSQFLVCFSS